jgi:hypothetical protein
MTDTATSLQAYEDQLAKEASEIKRTLSANVGSTISTRGKMFTMPDGRSHPGPLQCIILDFINYNLYYRDPFNAQDIKPPVCWAYNKYVDELGPADGVEEPQSDACSSCPHFQFGSAPNGRGKACRQTVKLAVVEPNPTEASEIMVISVSPTALKAWAGYLNLVDMKYNTVPAGVITEISFNPNETYPTLMFGNPQKHHDLATVMALRPMATQILASDPRGN